MRVRKGIVDLDQAYRHRRNTRNFIAITNCIMFSIAVALTITFDYFDLDLTGGWIIGCIEGAAFGILSVGLFWYFKSLREQRADDLANSQPILSGSPADVLMLSMHYSDPDQRATAVFESLLTPVQLNQWTKTRQVTVPLAGGRAAIIGTGRVWWSDGENQCVGPYMTFHDHMPMGDILLCQLLYLRNDPNYVRSVSQLVPIEQMGRGRRLPFGATVH